LIKFKWLKEYPVRKIDGARVVPWFECALELPDDPGMTVWYVAIGRLVFLVGWNDVFMKRKPPTMAKVLRFKR